MDYRILITWLVLGIVLFSGCNEKQQEQIPTVCNEPYIQVGRDCCLDRDDNRVCDRDEEMIVATTMDESTTVEASTTVEESTTTVETTTTAAPEITTTTVEETTTTTFKSTYGCTENAGYDPDSFIYVHSDGCGERFITQAESASADKEIPLTKLDISMLSSGEIGLLECFYGEYYPGSMEFGYCPRLLCPKTGRVENVDGTTPVSIQMRTFAQECV